MVGENGIMGRWRGRGEQLEGVSSLCVCETTVGGRVYKALSLKGHYVPYTLYRSQRRVVGVQMPQHSEWLRQLKSFPAQLDFSPWIQIGGQHSSFGNMLNI